MIAIWLVVNLFRIVEVGAGDGRLTYFLRNKFDELGFHNIDIIATDTGKMSREEEFY